MTPGVRVEYGRAGQAQVSMRGLRGQACVPLVYVDGVRIQANEIRSFASGGSLRAMEIYTRAWHAPEFASNLRSECGIIVIWTSMRIETSGEAAP
jgi:hypothetical protein